jgi:type IV secretion system protein VirB11
MQSKPLTLASNAGAAAPDAPGRDTALREALQMVQAYMRDDAITEICINRPGEAFTESAFGWQRHDMPAVTLAWCKKLAQLIATFSAQKVNEKDPLLSGSLPDGERVQVMIPPAVEHGTVSVTIRKPSFTTKTPEEFERDGLTDEVMDELAELAPHEQRLLQLKKDRDFWAFFRAAVELKKTIVISGATGSGKTTFGKMMVNFIPPHERLVTIEDVREMFLHLHPNRVHLLYSEGGSGTTEVTAKTLLKACLRMKPDRILLAEIRSKAAYDYIVNVSSGHPGSITTVHAGSCAEAFEMLMLRVKESDEGRELAREDIMNLLRAKIDVVIQFQVFERAGADGRVKKVRRITELYYDPAYKRKQLG